MFRHDLAVPKLLDKGEALVPIHPVGCIDSDIACGKHESEQTIEEQHLSTRDMEVIPSNAKAVYQ